MNVHEIMRRGSLVSPGAAPLLRDLPRRQEKRVMFAVQSEKPLLITAEFVFEAIIDSLPKNHNKSAKAG